MNSDNKPARSLREIEMEISEEGREWTRRRLEQRLQEEANRHGAVFPLSGRKAHHRKRQAMHQASIEPQGELFVVNFAYGRRGSTMNTGIKTPMPVDYDSAKNIYDKLIREKMAKGYTQGPDGTPYQNTSKEDRVTGLLPQLLNPIDEQEVKRLLKDPAGAMQEKFDGRGVLVRKAGAEIHGINRKGLLIGLPSPVVVGAHKITSNFSQRAHRNTAFTSPFYCRCKTSSQ
ncbi:MAG: hypothetical protein ACLQU3_30525 [Limisphaerales bacterium]